MKSLNRLPRGVLLTLVPVTLVLASSSVLAAQNTVPGEPLPGLDTFRLPSSAPTASPTARPALQPTSQPTPVAIPQVAPAGVATRTIAPPRIVPTIGATPGAGGAPPRTGPTRSAPTANARVPSRPVLQSSAPPVAAPTPLAPNPGPSERAVFPVSVAPTAVASSLPAPVATASPEAGDSRGGLVLGLILAGVVVVLGAIGIAVWRKRLRREREELEDDDAQMATEQPEEPALLASAPPAASVPAAPPPYAEPRARLEVELHPKRAGTNLLSAAVEYGIGVRNVGALTATCIHLDVRLLSAGSRQDATINALFLVPIAQPIITPFELAAQGAVELGGMAQHGKDTLEVFSVGGRALFVPVLTINLRYEWEGGSGQSARSYVIGIDRGPDAKLAPFQLDATRMHDAVSAIEYTMSVMS